MIKNRLTRKASTDVGGGFYGIDVRQGGTGEKKKGKKGFARD